MQLREYEDDDLEAVQRIWREVGWIDEDGTEFVEDFVQDAHVVVAVPEGAEGPEAATMVHDGTLDHTGSRLPLAVVTAVTTSRVGRRQGLARATLSAALRAATERGMVVAALGMFEQGFYDTVGFGTGAEQLWFRVDPAHLSDRLPYRHAPVRLRVEDAEELDRALRRRALPHGGVVLPSAPMRRAERSWDQDGFGLGYRDEEGELTHYVWCDARDEHGPYLVREWAWRDTGQLLELLGLLRSLGDQVRTVVLPEPAQLQLQVLVDHPARLERTRTEGPHRWEAKADAWWQARVLDLPACVAALRTVRDLRCNLHLTDPLDLPGCVGTWVLDLGPTSTARPGSDDDLPTLRASVNAFTRLWLGVRAASVLAATDDLAAPPELLAALDAAIRLPRPDVALDF